MCVLLLSYSNRKSLCASMLTPRDLSLKEKLNALHEVIPEVLNCSPLFLRTNYDNKIDSFNLLKKQYISVVLRLNALGVTIRDKEKRELLTKRCRRCIKVFNNDDFYYFFANIEEETDPLFSLFDPSDSSVSFQKRRLFTPIANNTGYGVRFNKNSSHREITARFGEAFRRECIVWLFIK